jgi:hypothetical protein
VIARRAGHASLAKFHDRSRNSVRWQAGRAPRPSSKLAPVTRMVGLLPTVPPVLLKECPALGQQPALPVSLRVVLRSPTDSSDPRSTERTTVRLSSATVIRVQFVQGATGASSTSAVSRQSHPGAGGSFA